MLAFLPPSVKKLISFYLIPCQAFSEDPKGFMNLSFNLQQSEFQNLYSDILNNIQPRQIFLFKIPSVSTILSKLF